MSNRKDLNREEEADAALRHTGIARGPAATLCGIFLLTLVSVPLVSAWRGLPWRAPAARRAAPVSPPAGGARLIQRAPGLVALWTDLPKPGAIRAFEDRVTQNSFLSRGLRPKVQAFLTSRLGVGSEDVYKGEDGWLFYRPDVDYVSGAGFLTPRALSLRQHSDPAIQPDPVRAILDFRRQLARRGIRLVVLPAPSKAAILPDRLGARWPTGRSLQNPSYGRFVGTLRQQGVTVVDPTAALLSLHRDSSYLRDDTHWTPAGLEAAAAGVASALRSGLPVQAGVRYEQQTVTVSNRGDIATMLQLPRTQPLYPDQRVTIHPVIDAAGRPWAVDHRADILLLGDSFSNIYSLGGMGWGGGAGLAERLSFLLHRPLDRIAVNAGGAFAARERLVESLRRGDDRLAGKRVVIWEFADRDLSFGDWRLLPLPAAPAVKKRPPPPAGALIVIGMIRSISRPPAPGSVPYKDCLIAIRLTGVHGISGHLARGDLLVYAWGLQDNVLSPAGSYHVGETLTLKLVPWSQVEDQYGSLNRRELDDPDALGLDAYWGETVRAD